MWTIVDNDDLPELQKYKWRAVRAYSKFYAVTKVNYRTIYMHRLLCNFPVEVDHKNDNSLDNRKSNLRPADRSQNLFNKSAVGVYRNGIGWRGQIYYHYKKYVSITYKTKEEALEWRRQKARELYGKFAP